MQAKVSVVTMYMVGTISGCCLLDAQMICGRTTSNLVPKVSMSSFSVFRSACDR